MTALDRFLNAAAVILWIVIGAAGLAVAITVLSLAGYGVLVLRDHIKEKRRRK